MADNLDITSVLTTLREDTDDERISLGDIVSSLEGRGFGPLLMAPALIAFLPSGAIPGIPSLCGILIALIAVQKVFGKSHPWIPSRLRKADFDRQRFSEGVDNITPVTKRIDRFFKPRLTFLFGPVISRLIAALCVVFGLLMIPLELIPMAAAIPALAIIFAAIGLSTRDGVMLVLALILFSVAGYWAGTEFGFL